MAIRYDEALNREIRRTVANFNKKVHRLEKDEKFILQENVEFLPETTSVRELKSKYTSRRLLKRELRQLQSFGKRGAERIVQTPGGVVATEWEHRINRQNIAYSKLILTLQIKKAGPSQGILKEDSVVNLIRRREELNKEYSKLSVRELEKINKTSEGVVERGKREELFKQNLLKRFNNALKQGNYPADILEALSHFTGEQLLDIYQNEPEFMDIMEYSNTDGQLGVDYLINKSSGAKIARSRFDQIVDKMVTNLDYYKKTYKK